MYIPNLDCTIYNSKNANDKNVYQMKQFNYYANL
jgi:hypothetical protein